MHDYEFNNTMEIRINLDADSLTFVPDVVYLLGTLNAHTIETVAARVGSHGALVDKNGNTVGGVYHRPPALWD